MSSGVARIALIASGRSPMQQLFRFTLQLNLVGGNSLFLDSQPLESPIEPNLLPIDITLNKTLATNY